jgi:hypothetical protein
MKKIVLVALLAMFSDLSTTCASCCLIEDDDVQNANITTFHCLTSPITKTLIIDAEKRWLHFDFTSLKPTLEDDEEISPTMSTISVNGQLGMHANAELPPIMGSVDGVMHPSKWFRVYAPYMDKIPMYAPLAINIYMTDNEIIQILENAFHCPIEVTKSWSIS